MTKYVFAYQGGDAPQTPQAQEQAMAEWGAWFGTLGDDLVEAGNPFGAAKRIGADGTVADSAASGLTGYSVVSTSSLDAAVSLAKGCPVLAAGGAVDVYEAIEM